LASAAPLARDSGCPPNRVNPKQRFTYINAAQRNSQCHRGVLGLSNRSDSLNCRGRTNEHSNHPQASDRRRSGRLGFPLCRLRRCPAFAASVVTKQRVVFPGLWGRAAAPIVCDASLWKLISGSRPSPRYWHGSAEAVPFRDGCADLVSMSMVLTNDSFRSTSTCNRSGRIILEDADSSHPPGWPRTVIIEYSPQGDHEGSSQRWERFLVRGQC